MPADAFWTLTMAVNVYLTFYFRFDARKLRKMEIPYLFFCYGIPFVIALIYIFVRTDVRGMMYGNAILWCWIANGWDVLRIATFYGPVWVTIFVTFFIYSRAGGEIYRKHKQLKELNYTSHYEPEPSYMMDPFSIKTTEVSVTSEVITSSEEGRVDLASVSPRSPAAAYSVTISSDTKPGKVRDSSSYDITPTSLPAPTVAPAPKPSRKRRGATFEATNAAWSYAKCALLFFTAMLVTWIPSSANRVYSVMNVEEISLPLLYMSAFVLPLQGFWNALIYVVTSWKACTMLFEDIHLFTATKTKPKVAEIISRTRHGNGTSFQMMSSGRNIRSGDKSSYETESTTELAQNSRPPSSYVGVATTKGQT